MIRKSQAELERFKITKTIRTLVRLKHSLAADEEINELLPDTLEEFDKALQAGKLMQIEAGIDEVLDAHTQTES
jgi:hypothetical protein